MKLEQTETGSNLAAPHYYKPGKRPLECAHCKRHRDEHPDGRMDGWAEARPLDGPKRPTFGPGWWVCLGFALATGIFLLIAELANLGII